MQIIVILLALLFSGPSANTTQTSAPQLTPAPVHFVSTGGSHFLFYGSLVAQLPQGFDPSPWTEKSSTLRTTYTGVDGVVHEVITVVATAGDGAAERAMCEHAKLVELMQKKYPPKPPPQG